MGGDTGAEARISRKGEFGEPRVEIQRVTLSGDLEIRINAKRSLLLHIEAEVENGGKEEYTTTLYSVYSYCVV